MKRYITDNISEWYSSPRRKPLVIRGARQVGKSTAVRNFAKSEGVELYEINLERHPGLERIFATLDPNKIISELEAVLSRTIVPENGILFLDEIQATPSAIPALRYFYEDMPELCVVSAGSLLEFVLASHKFSMPVGRIQYLNLEPMTFSEFLLAIGEEYFYELITTWKPGVTIAEQAHNYLIEHYRKYLLVGGMPEAIVAFREQGGLKEAQAVHLEIINTFVDDFSKYNTRIDVSLLGRVFEAIPAFIGHKVKYSALASELKANQVRNCIDLLARARLTTAVFHSKCSGVPLQASQDTNVYKLLYLDIGLLLTSLNLNMSAINSFSNSDLVNIGALSEQFVGQHLLSFVANRGKRNLSYWLREGKVNNAEIDFVLSEGLSIVPLEVKAGKSGRLRSLVQFVVKHGVANAIRFDLNLPSTQVVSTEVLVDQKRKESVKYYLHSLPLYLVESVGKVMLSF